MPTTVIATEARWFPMTDPHNPRYQIGNGREITTGNDSDRANVFEFVGRRADLVHRHRMIEETYWVLPDSCPVELWLDDLVVNLAPGARAVIAPGTWHATRPIGGDLHDSHIIVVAAPPFSEDDQEFMDPQPANWQYKWVP